ncbi:MAG: VWA domain-containing protein [Planctomycetes bacterium]|nr:VWA domain-containing protein [Planctomycetota bacterium]
MDRSPRLLALRLCGQDHALESGREYLLGTSRDCDLRLPASAAARHACLVVADSTVTVRAHDGAVRHNGVAVTAPMPVGVGDVLVFGDGLAEAIVVPDDGTASLVPIPELRLAAGERHVREAAQALLRQDPALARREAARRSAPWFTVSLLLHAAALLAFVWLFPTQPVSGDAPTTVGIDFGPVPLPDQAPPTPLPEVLPEPEVAPEPLASDPAPATAEIEPPTLEMPTATPSLDRLDDLAATRPTRADNAPEPTMPTDLASLGSGGFRKTVAELRQSGLEVVFVFDSTGSMSSTIDDTKATIVQMLTVLRALVPDARVGLVTFRDSGKRESYLVREVPLGLDPWRTSNFVQNVTAEGGGDRPEDVRAGLRAAFAQKWRAGARRVVVLAGDAPPHENDRLRIAQEVRSFAADGRSFVHALVTSPDRAGDDTHRAFTEIAREGKGTCEGLDTKDRVLQRVLALAFGREFDRDLANVLQAAEADAARVDVRALDLVRRGGPDLTRELRQNPVPMTVCNALVRRPRRVVVEQLVTMLGAADTPSHTRQALAGVLQRVLKLPAPPVDPVGDTAPPSRELDRLRRLARDLPD